MFQSTRKINLVIPSSYPQCTLEQLRSVSSIMLDLAHRATPLRPFSVFDLKIAAFILLADIEIVAPVNPRCPVEEQYYEVRFRAPWWKRILNRLTGNNEPFALYLWQIRQWVEGSKNTPGVLDWLDSDSRQPFILFPFDYVRCRHSGAKGLLGRVAFKGPEPLLNGFSWQRFRFAQDLMDNYVRQQNNLVKLCQSGRPSQEEVHKSVRSVETSKASFLACIFERKIRYTDEHGRIRHDWQYQSNQSFDNIEYFRGFSDVDWQIVLLWWSGTTQWLAKTYPRVFKRQAPQKGKMVSPAEIYARTTATIEKYVGVNSGELDKEPYDVVLQHIEDMIKENEEIERINRKTKK